MPEYAKPLPPNEGLHGEFYRFCANHELRFQRCAECQAWRHMPRECCADCGSFEWRWEASSGKGTLFSWTTIHHAIHPAFAEEVPYTSVVVEMEEGVRLVSRVVEVPEEDLVIGLPLEIKFVDIAEGVALHEFRRRRE